MMDFWGTVVLSDIVVQGILHTYIYTTRDE